MGSGSLFFPQMVTDLSMNVATQQANKQTNKQKYQNKTTQKFALVCLLKFTVKGHGRLQEN